MSKGIFGIEIEEIFFFLSSSNTFFLHIYSSGVGVLGSNSFGRFWIFGLSIIVESRGL